MKILSVIFACLITSCSTATITDNSTVFMGTELTANLYCGNGYSTRDLYVEDVPGTGSFWLGSWVEIVPVDGTSRFYIIKGYNRFYVDTASPHSSSQKFYGPFEGKPEDYFQLNKTEPVN